MTDRSEGHGRPAGPDVCTLLLLLPFKATAIALFSALGSGESWVVSCDGGLKIRITKFDAIMLLLRKIRPLGTCYASSSLHDFFKYNGFLRFHRYFRKKYRSRSIGY